MAFSAGGSFKLLINDSRIHFLAKFTPNHTSTINYAPQKSLPGTLTTVGWTSS